MKITLLAVLMMVLLPSPEEILAKDINNLSATRQAQRDSLKHPIVDVEQARSFEDPANWHSDFGDFTFKEGTLFPFVSIGGRITGAYFKGKGEITQVPTTKSERHQAIRYYGDSIFHASLSELYLRFPDAHQVSGLLELGEPKSGAKSPRSRELEDFEKSAYDDLGIDLASTILMLWGSPNRTHRLVYAQPKLRGHNRHHFLLDDEERENVVVLRRPPVDLTRPYVDNVFSFDSRQRTSTAAISPLNYDSLISSYVSDVAIKSNGEMDVRTTLTVLALHDDFSAFPLWAVPKMELDSVLFDNQQLEFAFDDETGRLTVFLPRPLSLGDSVQITIVYSSKHIMHQLPWGDYWISYTTSWLPRIPGVRGRTHFRTRYRYPKSYQLISSGELVEEFDDGNDHVAVWQSIGPAAWVSFNFGVFDHHRVPLSDTLPQIDVYRGRNHTGDLFARDFKTKVVEDIAGSLMFYSDIFGPYPYDHLSVTEVPGGHGQGHPQLLHLAWRSFQSNEPGRIEQHRAHEVAHQWWGHIIDWKTYHDQWLSEGFSEYAGAWYVQIKHPDGKEFDEILKNWRKAILERGEFNGWHDGFDQAPIWLGRRAASYDSPGTYYAVTYSKAAYVIHMLRMMMHDYVDSSDARFKSFLKGFVSKNSGSEVSTEDLIASLNEFAGEDMTWFFDQWIYGVEIPHLRYEWDSDRSKDGSYKVHGSIRQSGTTEPFRMSLPIRIRYADSDTVIVVDVRSAETQFTTPPQPEKPRGIEFNADKTILCFD